MAVAKGTANERHRRKLPSLGASAVVMDSGFDARWGNILHRPD